MLPTDAHFRHKDIQRLKVKDRKRYGNQKKPGVGTIIPEKIDLKKKKPIVRDKEEHKHL